MFWLPLIGVHSGMRIESIGVINPGAIFKAAPVSLHLALESVLIWLSKTGKLRHSTLFMLC